VVEAELVALEYLDRPGQGATAELVYNHQYLEQQHITQEVGAVPVIVGVLPAVMVAEETDRLGETPQDPVLLTQAVVVVATITVQVEILARAVQVL
jgi:hypothetical protein